MKSRLLSAALIFGATLACAAGVSPQTKWNLPRPAIRADNPHSEKSRAVRQGRRGGDRRQAADHRPSQRLAVQGARHQARRAEPARRRWARSCSRFHENERRDLRPSTSCRSSPPASRPRKISSRRRGRRSRRNSPAQGVVLLMGGAVGRRQGVYTKKDLNTIEDMKGLKWRSYNVGHRAYRRARRWRSRSRSRRPNCRRRSRPGVVNLVHVVGRHRLRLQGLGVTRPLSTMCRPGSRRTTPSSTKAAFDALDKPTQEAILKAARDRPRRAAGRPGRPRATGISTSSGPRA